MDYYIVTLMELNDAVENLLLSHEPLVDGTLIKLFKALNYPVGYKKLYMPTCAEQTIYTYGNNDENYTSGEISFMSSVPVMVKLCDFTVNDMEIEKNNVFYIELECRAEEKDLFACALIKLTNKAFTGYNYILIKCINSFAFGTKIFSESTKNDDFYISKWFDISDHDIMPFCFDLLESRTARETYYNYSQTVIENSYFDSHYTKSIYDNNLYGFEENDDDFQDINISNQVKKADEPYYKPNQYKVISDELKFIKSNTETSYEALQLAENIANKQNIFEQQTQQLSVAGASFIKEDAKKIDNINEKIFEDAEQMLKYV